MAEFRRDPLTGHTVLFSPGRAARPDQFAAARSGEPVANVADDPFAPGHEDQTPPELFAIRPDGSAPGTPGWTLRVVPNSYPAVAPSGPATGRHEVIIETVDGARDLAELSPGQVALVVTAWRDRLRHCEADPALAWGLVFKNSGAAAGASIVHAHSQLLALGVIPENIQRLVNTERDHFTAHGACAMCATITNEQTAGLRIVRADDRFVLYCPWASRFPFEMRIAPVHHSARVTRMSDAECTSLGCLLHDALRRLRQVAPNAPYNLVVRTAPLRDPAGEDCSHWWIEILPRIGQLAGFELATGMFLNTVTPEDAANRLRETKPILHVRPLRDDDYPALVALFRKTVRTVNRRDYSLAQVIAWAPDEISLSDWRQRFAHEAVFVAECDGVITGFCGYEANGHLDMFYVHADWQGRGVGSSLWAALEADVNERGITRVFTEASITARHFFERLGFAHLAEQVVTLRGESFINHRMEKRW
jgi:UDPglucose--hexose-1-phosphate uridylyltransferase